MTEVDKPPTKENDDEEEEPPLPIQPFNFYLKPEVTFKICSTRWGLFTCLGGLIYSYHLVITIAGVNCFCDYTRSIPCNGASVGEEASAQLDLYIALPTIFHMIEWIRWTIFLTSVLVNVDLIKVYYALSVNIGFGFIAMILALVGRLGASSCAVEQESRSMFLSLQIVFLVLHVPFSMMHVWYFYLKKVDWCHETYLADPDEEEEEEEGGGCLGMFFGKKEDEEEDGSQKVAQDE